MLAYRKLHRKLRYLDADKRKKIYQAYKLALQGHHNQRRDSGEKYINHPIAVAEILAEMHFDYQAIIAALLHDIIEDTNITKEEIAHQFSQTIAELVDGVTKLTQIESSGNKDEKQAQNFRKMVLAMSRDIRVIIIKLADRLHNMRTVLEVAPFKRNRIAKETLEIYAPIAHRLGMYQFYAQLEDLAFAALYPRRYRIIEKAVAKIYGRHQGIIKQLKKEMEQTIAKSTIKDSKISGRTKHLYSIYKKMLEHRASLANIMDIYGFRVIVPSTDDCYRALGIIHSIYKPIYEKFKDYIAAPKFNGYQSLHTVLFGPYGAPVEIQIRTQEMDHAANSGIASHWIYKTGEDAANKAQLLTEHWITGLLDLQKQSDNSEEFLEGVKMELYPDKVFVFTPKGKIIELIKGATVIDFAYMVHTDIGNSCTAVRINRKFAPLSTTLTNGQNISIITSKNAEPSPNWLSFAVTTKARHCIRQYLKNKKQLELINLGEQLLDTAFAEIPFDSAQISAKTLTNFIEKNNLKDSNDLYENIGLGNHLATLVAYQLINNNEKKDGFSEKSTTKSLVIKGSKGMALTFANCCYPIPGDPIIGYLNSGYGIDIHTQDCITLAKLSRHPEKHLKVEWAEDITSDFKVVIVVEIVNHIGALAELSQAIAKANANMDSIHSDANNNNYAILHIEIFVKNLSHLERVKRHISNLPTVIGVVRKKVGKEF